MDSTTIIHVAEIFAAALCVSLGSGMAALGQGRAVGQGLEAMSRQPEMMGALRVNMIIGLAIIESLAIYCLFISLVLLFAKW